MATLIPPFLTTLGVLTNITDAEETMGEAGGQDHGQRWGVTSGMQRCEHRRAILSTGMPKDKKQLFKQENICMKYLRHLATPGSCKKFFLSNAFHFFTFSNHK